MQQHEERDPEQINREPLALRREILLCQETSLSCITHSDGTDAYGGTALNNQDGPLQTSQILYRLRASYLGCIRFQP